MLVCTSIGRATVSLCANGSGALAVVFVQLACTAFGIVAVDKPCCVILPQVPTFSSSLLTGTPTQRVAATLNGVFHHTHVPHICLESSKGLVFPTCLYFIYFLCVLPDVGEAAPYGRVFNIL